MDKEIGKMKRRSEHSKRLLSYLVMRQGVVDISNILARKVLEEEADYYYPSISSVREHVRKMTAPGCCGHQVLKNAADPYYSSIACVRAHVKQINDRRHYINMRKDYEKS